MEDVATRLKNALDTIFGRPPLWAYEMKGKTSDQVILILTKEMAEQLADDYERMAE